MDYATFKVSFWTGGAAATIRSAGPINFAVAAYLRTCPHANLLGLYHLPLAYVSHDLGLDEKTLREATIALARARFAFYDHPTSHVWVVEMAAEELPLPLKAGDNRVKRARSVYECLAPNPFLGRFFDRYGEALRLPTRRGEDTVPEPAGQIELPEFEEAPPKGLRGPSEGAGGRPADPWRGGDRVGGEGAPEGLPPDHPALDPEAPTWSSGSGSPAPRPIGPDRRARELIPRLRRRAIDANRGDPLAPPWAAGELAGILSQGRTEADVERVWEFMLRTARSSETVGFRFFFRNYDVLEDRLVAEGGSTDGSD